MNENRLLFLKDVFPELELEVADDFSKATIINPNYNENITVYDDEFEFTVYFSFQHCHFKNEDEVIEWIRNVISGNTFAIEFFNKEQRRFGGEIALAELQGLSYQRLEQLTGYYGSTKLKEVADSFKIRGWDSKNNFDYTISCEVNGNISINKSFVGML